MLLVAQHTQKDPKEYMLFLNELQEHDELYRYVSVCLLTVCMSVCRSVCWSVSSIFVCTFIDKYFTAYMSVYVAVNGVGE